MSQPTHPTRTAAQPSRCLPRKTMPRPLPPSPFRTTPRPRARAPWFPALRPQLRLQVQTHSPQLRSTARLQSSARMARLRRSPSNPRQTPLSKAPSPRSSSRMVRPFRSSHKASATLTSPTTSSRATATRSTRSRSSRRTMATRSLLQTVSVRVGCLASALAPARRTARIRRARKARPNPIGLVCPRRQTPSSLLWSPRWSLRLCAWASAMRPSPTAG